MIFIEQIGHGECVITAVVKWTYDARLLEKIKLVFQQFDLPTMPSLDIARVRMSVDLFSQAFLTSGNSHKNFKDTLNSTHGDIDTTELSEDCMRGGDTSKFYE